MSNLFCSGMVTVLLLIAAGVADAGPATTRGFDEGFIPLPRNIFLKDRMAPARPPELGPDVPLPRPIEESLVLRGVVHNNDRYVVYVEDTKNSRMLKLGVGDRIAGGIVARITIDSIEYQNHDEQTLVLLGSNLMGSATIRSRRIP